MKIVTVVGARPQFIKAAVVSRAIRAAHVGLEEAIAHTGQHFDDNMSDIFFRELDIPKPKVHLGVPGGRHGHATGLMLTRLEEVLIADRPDMVLVYGDTNSTLAGSLAAAKLHIPVAHVEAGLRSFNRLMPEEINRVITDHLSDLLFCPSDVSAHNLAREGITQGVRVVGDVMYDAVLHYRDRAPSLQKRSGPYAVATVHRVENTDDPARLRGIIAGLSRLPVPVVLPLHPRTRKALAAHNITVPQRIEIIEPVGYLEMIALVRHSVFVLTDSGGLQKEAYFLRRKCITLRDETEWVELVDCGANRLTGADPDRIAGAAEWALEDLSTDVRLYGDGRGAQEIVNVLAAYGESVRL